GIPGYDFIDVNTGSGGYFEILKIGNEKVSSLTKSGVFQPGVTFSEATMTLNLENYIGTSDPLILSFRYMGHSDTNPFGNPPGSKVYFRGTDQDSWVNIQDLVFDKNWNNIAGIDLSALITANSQDFSSSSQLRFVQDDIYDFYLDDINVTAASQLPVEMSSFDVSKVNSGDALVEWITESEFENDYFEVEVSAGSSANKDFRSLTRIDGKGLSTSTSFYTFTDKEPNKTGLRYYRIKQVDLDGTTTYSNVKSLRFAESIARVAVYPNPVIDKFSLHYEAELDEEIRVHLISLTGRTLFKERFLVEKGHHEFPLEVDPNLPVGLYMLQVIYPNDRVTTVPLSKK
ncbi:MAG: T9SS type A sorting domain-containing protein, partial [Saprospiraceae bacterium]|nr:T9SS type A sorting domain-containing protein [Saprospiraceae bacterium]